ncbi:MAG: hypothetical protein AAGF19_06155, partial [Pseudomonadota bacterium]
MIRKQSQQKEARKEQVKRSRSEDGQAKAPPKASSSASQVAGSEDAGKPAPTAASRKPATRPTPEPTAKPADPADRPVATPRDARSARYAAPDAPSGDASTEPSGPGGHAPDASPTKSDTKKSEPRAATPRDAETRERAPRTPDASRPVREPRALRRERTDETNSAREDKAAARTPPPSSSPDEADLDAQLAESLTPPERKSLFSSGFIRAAVILLVLGAGILMGLRQFSAPGPQGLAETPEAIAPTGEGVEGTEPATADPLPGEPQSENLAQLPPTDGQEAIVPPSAPAPDPADVERLAALNAVKDALKTYTDEAIVEDTLTPEPLLAAADQLQASQGEHDIIVGFLTEDLREFAGAVASLPEDPAASPELDVVKYTRDDNTTRIEALIEEVSQRIADAEAVVVAQA